MTEIPRPGKQFELQPLDDEPFPSLRSIRAQVEVKAILEALRRTDWNRKQAARLLSISYRGLLYKIRQHKLESGRV
jgi:DNA-binding NtrC family response regulator